MPILSLPINISPRIRRHGAHLALVAQLARLYWLLKLLLAGYRHVRARSITGTFNELVSYIRNVIVRLVISLPSSRAKISSELAKTRQDLKAKLAPSTYGPGIDLTNVRSLPEKGRDLDWLKSEWSNMKKLERGDVDDGRVSGTVYHGGADLNAIINEAMSKFVVTNPLHPDVFPGVRKMESEIVSMCLDLFHAPNGAGTTTSGGTESILMACKSYRDWARDTKGIKNPEMIIPSSAHAAFWKASQYFNIKLHVIPVDPESRKADVRRMRRAINPNTIMLVGSAPNFPDGAVDPIPALAALAKKHRIGLHVDCCLGSFLMPFMIRAGFGDGLEKFDFEVDGVTSISCDTHKYAFCPKGSSVIMYHSAELRKYQYYIMTDWAGGVYASPSMAGSRPGSVLAGAWAVMNHFGVEGYTESCRTIISASRHLASSLRLIPELYILGNPLISVVAFASKSPQVNIYAVGDGLSKRGWHLNALRDPAALHLACTIPTAAKIDVLIEDLKEVIEEVKSKPGGSGDMVALYGLGQTSVGPHVVGKLAEAFLDTLYE